MRRAVLMTLALCARATAVSVELDAAALDECRHRFYQDYTVEWAACRAVVGMGAAPPRSAQGAPRAVVPKVFITSDKEWSEGVAVRKQAWLKLNPGYEWRFFSDVEGEEWLAAAYGKETAALYRSIVDGPIRADFFRVFYLAREGGVWVDIDVVPTAPLAAFGTDDATPWVPRSRNVGMLNPTVIVTPAQHTTLLAAVAAYRRIAAEEYNYWAWSVVHVMGALMHRGWMVDTPAVEACPDINNPWSCFIALDAPDGRGAAALEAPRLFNNRGQDYNPNTHGWMGAADEIFFASNASNATITPTASNTDVTVTKQSASSSAKQSASSSSAIIEVTVTHRSAPESESESSGFSPLGITIACVGGAAAVGAAAFFGIKAKAGAKAVKLPDYEYEEVPNEGLL